MSQIDFNTKNNLLTQIYNTATKKMNSNYFTKEQKKLLGHDLDDILYGCSWNNEPCSSNEFVWSFDKWFGNCWSFNSGFNSSGLILTYPIKGWYKSHLIIFDSYYQRFP